MYRHRLSIISYIRYADDFVVLLTSTKEFAESLNKYKTIE